MGELSRAVTVAVLCAFALCAGALFSAASAVAGAPSSAIRVDQVGYASTAPKRAYLISRTAQSGAPFAVQAAGAGAPALSGTVGASLGSWSKRYRYVYALDFDAVQAPGSYAIALGGKAGALSPPFAVAAPASLYERPLANALSFYENERDGPQYIASALRSAPAHLNDQTASVFTTPQVNGGGAFKGDLAATGETIDASGGWFDAGDYLKFVQTTSYTVDVLLAGVRDFPAQMGASAPAGGFTAEARFGVEWLLRMFDDRGGTLYYQVGIGEGNAKTLGDHDIWRLPQADDGYGGSDSSARYIRHRPVFRAGPPGSPISPNLAGRDAAAFALCYQDYKSTLPTLAARCLLAAEHVFELADTSPKGDLITAIPFDFYPESEWRDDLELGATELAIALSSPGALPGGLAHTDASFYLQHAAQWAGAYISHAGAGDPLNLYDVSGLAHFELVRALRQAGNPSGLAVSQAQLIGNLADQLDAAVAQSREDPFGFGFPWAEADTASHGDGLSVMAAEYEQLTGSHGYRSLSARWLDNVLGANAWGASLIVGDGSTFADCPSHQLANLAGSLDGSAPVLAGAVVEGPSDQASKGKVAGMRKCPARGNAFAPYDNAAVFKDDVQSYSTVEPAIDLTASSPLAFSWQVTAAAPLPSTG
jgi:endoglucanase